MGRAECPGQRSHPMTMPVADHRLVGAMRLRRLRPPSVARPRQRRLQFFFDQRFDKAPHLRAQRRLDRIEPIVEKSFVGDISRRIHAISFHGAISIGALSRFSLLKQRGDYATFNFQPLPLRHLTTAA